MAVMPMPVAQAGATLAVEDLRIEAGGDDRVKLLRGVSVSVAPGKVVGLIGESGSGKTMTCRAIAGALPRGVGIAGGRVTIGDRVLHDEHTATAPARDSGVAMVFADPHAALDPLQRIGAQIAEVARVQRGAGRREARVRARELLAAVAISDPERVAKLFPFEVSGGMAQRAMIASVLAGAPRFILADEPTSALDATVQLEILDLLGALARDEGVGLVLTTHDMAAAARICDWICVMYAGRVVESGPARAVLERPQHPYTRLLVEARPRGTRAQRLTAIPGEPPTPGDVVSGCPFAPRCPYVTDLCREAMPALVPYPGGGRAACHFTNQRLVERG